MVETKNIILVLQFIVYPASKHQYRIVVSLCAGGALSFNHERVIDSYLLPELILAESRKQIQSLDGRGPPPAVTLNLLVSTEHVDPLFIETAGRMKVASLV